MPASPAVEPPGVKIVDRLQDLVALRRLRWLKHGASIAGIGDNRHRIVRPKLGDQQAEGRAQQRQLVGFVHRTGHVDQEDKIRLRLLRRSHVKALDRNMHQLGVGVPRRRHHADGGIERRFGAVRPLPVVGKIIDHLLDAHRIGLRQNSFLQRPPHEGVGRSVDVDREGRHRVLQRGLHGIGLEGLDAVAVFFRLRQNISRRMAPAWPRALAHTASRQPRLRVLAARRLPAPWRQAQPVQRRGSAVVQLRPCRPHSPVSPGRRQATARSSTRPSCIRRGLRHPGRPSCRGASASLIGLSCRLPAAASFSWQVRWWRRSCSTGGFSIADHRSRCAEQIRRRPHQFKSRISGDRQGDEAGKGRRGYHFLLHHLTPELPGSFGETRPRRQSLGGFRTFFRLESRNRRFQRAHAGCRVRRGNALVAQLHQFVDRQP